MRQSALLSDSSFEAQLLTFCGNLAGFGSRMGTYDGICLNTIAIRLEAIAIRLAAIAIR